MKFGAGGRHEGSSKGLFWGKRSGDGREERAEQHLVPFWAVLLKAARVQCSHHLLTGRASSARWTTAVGLLTLC